MAKGKPYRVDEGDVTTTEFVKLNGKFEVNGISEILDNCIDGDGNPVFTEMWGSLRLSLKFRRTDGENGPAFSATPSQFIALVHKFGGDFNGLEVTRENRKSSEVILAGKDSANSAGKAFTVTAKNDWVNFLPELEPPIGRYTVRFKGAHRPKREENNYDFFPFETKNGTSPALFFDFEIVGGASGDPSIWDGHELSIFMNDVFTDEITTLEGTRVRAVEKGLPLYYHTAGGGIPKNAQRWDIFVEYFAPTALDHDWQVDRNESEYGVCEVLKPQYVYINHALKCDQRVQIAWRELDKKKGRYFDLADVPMLQDPPAIHLEEVVEFPFKEFDTLTNYLQGKWSSTTIFSTLTETEAVFSEEGRAWAKEHMGGETGPWVRAGMALKDRSALHSLTAAQLTNLYNEFVAQYGELSDDEGW